MCTVLLPPSVNPIGVNKYDDDDDDYDDDDDMVMI